MGLRDAEANHGIDAAQDEIARLTAALQQAEDRADEAEALLDDQMRTVGELEAKLSDCEKELAILRNVHYRPDDGRGCRERVEELEAELDAVCDAINLYGDETLHKALDDIGWRKAAKGEGK